MEKRFFFSNNRKGFKKYNIKVRNERKKEKQVINEMYILVNLLAMAYITKLMRNL